MTHNATPTFPCPYCNTLSSETDTLCQICGGYIPSEDTNERGSFDKKAALSTRSNSKSLLDTLEDIKEWPCSECHHSNLFNTELCVKCGELAHFSSRRVIENIGASLEIDKQSSSKDKRYFVRDKEDVLINPVNISHLSMEGANFQDGRNGVIETDKMVDTSGKDDVSNKWGKRDYAMSPEEKEPRSNSYSYSDVSGDIKDHIEDKKDYWMNPVEQKSIDFEMLENICPERYNMKDDEDDVMHSVKNTIFLSSHHSDILDDNLDTSQDGANAEDGGTGGIDTDEMADTSGKDEVSNKYAKRDYAMSPEEKEPRSNSYPYSDVSGDIKDHIEDKEDYWMNLVEQKSIDSEMLENICQDTHNMEDDVVVPKKKALCLNSNDSNQPSDVTYHSRDRREYVKDMTDVVRVENGGKSRSNTSSCSEQSLDKGVNDNEDGGGSPGSNVRQSCVDRDDSGAMVNDVMLPCGVEECDSVRSVYTSLDDDEEKSSLTKKEDTLSYSSEKKYEDDNFESRNKSGDKKDNYVSVENEDKMRSCSNNSDESNDMYKTFNTCYEKDGVDDKKDDAMHRGGTKGEDLEMLENICPERYNMKDEEDNLMHADQSTTCLSSHDSDVLDDSLYTSQDGPNVGDGGKGVSDGDKRAHKRGKDVVSNKWEKRDDVMGQDEMKFTCNTSSCSDGSIGNDKHYTICDTSDEIVDKEDAGLNLGDRKEGACVGDDTKGVLDSDEMADRRVKDDVSNKWEKNEDIMSPEKNNARSNSSSCSDVSVQMDQSFITPNRSDHINDKEDKVMNRKLLHSNSSSCSDGPTLFDGRSDIERADHSSYSDNWNGMSSDGRLSMKDEERRSPGGNAGQSCIGTDTGDNVELQSGVIEVRVDVPLEEGDEKVDLTKNGKEGCKWVCVHCSCHNSLNVNTCVACDMYAPFIMQWKCDKCGDDNDQLSQKCRGCNAENLYVEFCEKCNSSLINRKFRVMCDMCKKENDVIDYNKNNTYSSLDVSKCEDDDFESGDTSGGMRVDDVSVLSRDEMTSIDRDNHSSVCYDRGEIRDEEDDNGDDSPCPDDLNGTCSIKDNEDGERCLGEDVIQSNAESVDVDDKDTWTCMHCGYFNLWPANSCYTCGMYAPGIVKWKCKECTFNNDEMSVRCGACYYRNEFIMCCMQCQRSNINTKFREVCGKCQEENERIGEDNEKLAQRETFPNDKDVDETEGSDSDGIRRRRTNDHSDLNMEIE